MLGEFVWGSSPLLTLPGLHWEFVIVSRVPSASPKCIKTSRDQGGGPRLPPEMAAPALPGLDQSQTQALLAKAADIDPCDDEDDDDMEEVAALPNAKDANGFQDLLRGVGGGQALKQLRDAEKLASLASSKTIEYSIFEKFDKDGSGTIEMEELETALGEYGVADLTSQGGAALLKKYDTDGNGGLEFPEFKNLVRELDLLTTEKKMFQDDIARLNKRIHDSKVGLLNPRGLFVQVWDITTAIALLYTMFITPYEVGLDLPTAFNALFLSNSVVTIIFLIDIIVQFFLPTQRRTSVRGQADYERRHAILAKNYLVSWFPLDFITIIPFDVLVWAGVVTGEVKMVKILRVMRLLKGARASPR